MMQFPVISIKGATRIVAYASILKAVLGLRTLLLYGYVGVDTFIGPLVWTVISVFFFTLYKNMK